LFDIPKMAGISSQNLRAHFGLFDKAKALLLLLDGLALVEAWVAENHWLLVKHASVPRCMNRITHAILNFAWSLRSAQRIYLGDQGPGGRAAYAIVG
jgi:hypothetical protein